MKILIACDPEEGKSTEVALYLKSEAERMNRRVVVLNVRDLQKSLSSFEVVIVVGEFYRNDVGKCVLDFIERNLAQLNMVPSFFIPILACEDENDLKVPETKRQMLRTAIEKMGWKPQQALFAPIGVKFHNNQFITQADWPELKISLQRFLIRNDLMMAS